MNVFFLGTIIAKRQSMKLVPHTLTLFIYIFFKIFLCITITSCKAGSYHGPRAIIIILIINIIVTPNEAPTPLWHCALLVPVNIWSWINPSQPSCTACYWPIEIFWQLHRPTCPSLPPNWEEAVAVVPWDISGVKSSVKGGLARVRFMEGHRVFMRAPASQATFVWSQSSWGRLELHLRVTQSRLGLFWQRINIEV